MHQIHINADRIIWTNLKEFETESSETVKIETVETEYDTEEVSKISEDENSSSREEESDQVELEEGSSDEEDEPISITIDEPKVEMKGPSDNNEGAAIQYIQVVTL